VQWQFIANWTIRKWLGVYFQLPANRNEITA
jgi:hypothetical protein